MKTIIEPFRIKSVERLKMTTEAQRKRLLKDAHYNVVLLNSDDVLIDLLTDSGTTAMSSEQWAGLHLGDESYVRSPSYYKFVAAVQKYMPFKHVLPTHQGRPAERILACVVSQNGSIIPNNSHFDTTRENFSQANAVPIDLVIGEAKDPASPHPFKGNMDISKLASLLETSQQDIPLVMLTITNNAVGGQPVSMANIRQTSELCKSYDIPLFFDACRFAENAYLIKCNEEEYKNISIKNIVVEMFSYADGMTMSAKKDALVNTGGWLALNDDQWAAKAMDQLLLTEGFVTYGGLAGRDLHAMAIGIEEGIDEDYLKYRINSVKYLGDALNKIGIPVLQPFGGHAIYIDVQAMFPNIPESAYPGQVLNRALYEEAGIRACEISSVKLDSSAKTKNNSEKIIVRLAIPRRVYTQSHLDYIAEAFDNINQNKAKIQGLSMTHDAHPLRQYAAQFEPLITQ
ncbi:tryptophanase [Moritella viscosa]|uniref:Tryptophanase n=1 Tax=Moritella viscosa TaxID=80854 RepID=A0A1L0A3A3_9GAMM|nr:tryptophanase [Moritella viscosa]SGY95965.1 Tryptophanase [Moritella viscosa]SGZ08216.1 Tryptophanase [Moritella viscosa]SGZ08296.1 Tryptophanase [Moritella viscosa]SHO15531.1 Tryptophanase [Moritella viscosa]SHO27177.1 Tryptophanase [Moritella viscosa]